MYLTLRMLAWIIRYLIANRPPSSFYELETGEKLSELAEKEASTRYPNTHKEVETQ
jgi:hypothetical protein